MTVGAIILAAGSSRRFGDDKRRQVLPDGNTILKQAIDNAAAVMAPVLVVLRQADNAFEAQLRQDIDHPQVSYFRAPDSALGMAHSLANAIHAVKDWEAAVVFLGDMPYLQPNTIQAIVETYRANRSGAPIVIPAHNGKTGHPVVFSNAYFNEIGTLTGDVGARDVVSAHADKVIRVQVEDAGVLRDIDTPAEI